MNWDRQAFSRFEPMRAAVRTVLVFTIIGPPIGAITWLLGGVFLPEAGFFNLLAIPFSYYFGALSAAAVGVLVSIWGVFRGRPPIIVASVAGVLVFIASSIGAKTIGDGWVFHTVRLLAYMIPAWTCWSLAQLFWIKKS